MPTFSLMPSTVIVVTVITIIVPLKKRENRYRKTEMKVVKISHCVILH